MESGWEIRRGLPLNRAQILVAIGSLPLACMGAVMIASNPSQAAYESYATRELVTYLDHNVCSEAPVAFGLRKDCVAMLKNNRSQIRQFIAENTHQQNFVLFSIYTTDLSVASFLPSYRIETIGAFDQFYIYETIKE